MIFESLRWVNCEVKKEYSVMSDSYNYFETIGFESCEIKKVSSELSSAEVV